ncbi:MAG TPA: Clp protease ClpP [Clostridia bacterium]|nr:Clp protease ClpP [Clostridia bacterium]
MKKFWKFQAKSKDKAELEIYGDISDTTWYGDEVTPKQFKKDLDALGDVKEIDLYINSGGGDVFAGQAIYSMLKRHDAKITVHVDGLAASIASVIAMAGDRILIPQGSMMMVHEGMIGLLGFFYGKRLRQFAEEIDKITDSVIVPAYGRTGKTEEEIRKLLSEETWMSAEDAVELGFADEIEEGKSVAASIIGDKLTVNGVAANLTAFKSIPRAFLGMVQTEPPLPDEPIPIEPEPNEPEDSGKDTLLLDIDLI